MGFRPTGVPDDEPYRCAVGSGFDDRFVGQFTYEGKAKSGFVVEAFRGLDGWQVGYLVWVESSPPVSDLDLDEVLGEIAPDSDPVRDTEQFLGSDGVGDRFGDCQPEVGDPIRCHVGIGSGHRSDDGPYELQVFGLGRHLKFDDVAQDDTLPAGRPQQLGRRGG